MLKMSIPVTVMSCRIPKTAGAKVYATFGFTGGMVNCAVAPELVSTIQSRRGEELLGVFCMIPRNAMVFNHTRTVFEPVEMLDIITTSKLGEGGNYEK